MPTKAVLTLLAWCVAGLGIPAAYAENASRPLGEPNLDAPTLHSLGAWWVIQGDDNKNASLDCAFRKAGEAEWRPGPPLFRVGKDAHKDQKGKSKVDVPKDAWLFAGSLLLLDPDTEYEWRLKLADPDGGEAENILKSRTTVEPLFPHPLREFHVVPGEGEGNGTKENPFHGLVAAQQTARPGDLFLVHAGSYPAPFVADKSGEPGKPVVWRGAGDGEARIEGREPRPERGLSAGDIHDVWFERLTVQGVNYGLVGHRSARLVVRRCHFHHVEYGLTWTNNDKDGTNGFFVSDNTIEGPSVWPRTKEKGIENARGIQATGTGHEVCYNRIRGFADAMDTFGSQRCVAIDFHHNDCGECTDDGCEMDYSERNTRCFYNRFTNVFQGISVQPLFGGPVYIFRNALYNVEQEPFKVHNSPSGALFFHNTCVKKGEPLIIWTADKFTNCRSWNNLFIGSSGRAYDCSAPSADCEYDYDGFGGFSGEVFLKWNGVKYATADEVRAKAPIYKNLTLVDPATAFATGIRPPEDVHLQQDWGLNDLRLKEGAAAIDAGKVLPGMNDGFAGKAPDLGAYELGGERPHYGPRPEK